MPNIPPPGFTPPATGPTPPQNVNINPVTNPSPSNPEYMTNRSRFYRTQNRRSTRQALIFFALTAILIVVIIFFGIPLLVKAAGFLLDLRSASTPAQKTSSTAPPPPQLLPLTYEATNSSTITISGYSQPGFQITLFQNSQTVKDLVTDQDGNFTFSGLTLEPGENQFWTTTKNSDNIDSQLSNQISITYDQTPPSLDITSPLPDTKYYGPEEKTVTATGKTEPDCTLYLNDRLINISSKGDFSYPYTLSNGDNQLHFQATDPAGNSTSADITVSFTP